MVAVAQIEISQMELKVVDSTNSAQIAVVDPVEASETEPLIKRMRLGEPCDMCGSPCGSSASAFCQRCSSLTSVAAIELVRKNFMDACTLQCDLSDVQAKSIVDHISTHCRLQGTVDEFTMNGLRDKLRSCKSDKAFNKVLKRILSAELTPFVRTILRLDCRDKFIHAIRQMWSQEFITHYLTYEVTMWSTSHAVPKNARDLLVIDRNAPADPTELEQRNFKDLPITLSLHSSCRILVKDMCTAEYAFMSMAILEKEKQMQKSSGFVYVPGKNNKANLSYLHTMKKSAQQKQENLRRQFYNSILGHDAFSDVPKPADSSDSVSDATKPATTIPPADQVIGGDDTDFDDGVDTEDLAAHVLTGSTAKAFTADSEGTNLLDDNAVSSYNPQKLGQRTKDMDAIKSPKAPSVADIGVQKPPPLTENQLSKFYHPHKNAFTKAVFASLQDPSDACMYIVPEGFTSLEFCFDEIPELFLRTDKPDHISCIVALEDAYSPLTFLIAVQPAVLSNLRTLSLLVPAEFSRTDGW
jgi:hypothetical protein